MILRDQVNRKRNWSGVVLWILPLMAVVGLVFFIWPVDDEAVEKDSNTNHLIFNCDLEHSDALVFTSDTLAFDGAPFKSNSFSRSGKFSIRLNNKEKYGLAVAIKPNNYLATYHLSIWRYNPDNIDSWLVASDLDGGSFYIATKETSDVGDDGWEKLHLVFQVPKEVDSLKLYCYAGGDGANVYFDDFVFETSDLSKIAVANEIATLSLQISEEGFNKLTKKRDDAWSLGVLESSDLDWIKGKLSTEGEEYNVKLRLKGDWLDHLKGTKWSFRVKIKEPKSLWGMRTINLQRPETRGFLQEWVYHQWLEKEDILSPRYTYVLLKLNGTVLGFYALEEHFEKDLVESRNRREGPIVKFTEDRFWKGVSRQFQELGKNRFPLANNKEDAYWASEFRPFKESQTIASEDLSNHFLRATTLLTKFKYERDSLDLVFDVDRLGKYLAIVDLCGGYHSLTWHNQRWYYNPLSDLLEPVGFDGFTDRPPSLPTGSFLAEEVYKGIKEPFEPYKKMFYNEAIVSSYVHYLEEFSQNQYLDSLFRSLHTHIPLYEELFKQEYFDYTFSTSSYINRATRIRLSLLPYDGLSLLSYQDPGGDRLFFKNTHYLPLQVESTKIKNGQWVKNLDATIIYPNAKGSVLTSCPSRENVEAVRYKVLGMDKLFYSEVSMWPGPYVKNLGKRSNIETHPLCALFGDRVVLQSGTTDLPILIPEGKQVEVPEGTEINLIENAYILSLSVMTFLGSKDMPVTIRSEDGTGAVLVERAPTKSTFSYVHFINLGRVYSDQYRLTGGVTCYESEVFIHNCVFANSRQEDALNIVRTSFVLRDCLFDQTASDAFDADFCDGAIFGCHFNNTGNDAMDFSGSRVEIQDCFMKNIGDKGISTGENSYVKAINVTIGGAPTGVASKDQSTLIINNITLNRVTTGFTAYQKKSTFGPAKIIVDNYTAEEVKHLYIIEEGSSLILNKVEVQVN